MADQKNRLTKGSITLKEMIIISYDAYRKLDDKSWRASIDIVNAKLIKRINFNYNPHTKNWEQNSRECKFVFIVRSDPKSYKKTDNVKIHTYPVTVVCKDISRGIDTPIKIRCGSLYKPKSIRKGITTEQRKKFIDQDIKNGVELGFFYNESWVLQQFGLLHGINWASYPPRKTNPNYFPYFCKHLWFISSRILVPLLSSSKKRMLLNGLWKNET